MSKYPECFPDNFEEDILPEGAKNENKSVYRVIKYGTINRDGFIGTMPHRGKSMKHEQWILCPVCGCKTRLKIREDTVLENFPLYCPKCKHETLIAVRQLNMSVIKEPDAQTQSR